jgi:mannose-6-phosphate isomerase
VKESIITVEHAGTRLVRKPWGSRNLLPWSTMDHDGEAIGEIWFQRASTTAPDPALLFKLLFANQTLSIQVHPDDVFARSIGLPHGKTEAWYVLAATNDAKVAVGLKRCLTTQQLRISIEDGSISELVRWQPVQKGDVVFVPAGMIHAIGPGVVIAEIQQSSDATFRLFDYGRERELHVDNAVAVAQAGPAGRQAPSRRLSDSRTLLIASPTFVLERIDLAPNSGWDLDATGETWLLVLEGQAQLGSMHASAGEAFFLAADRAAIETDAVGLTGLVAYVATEPRSSLLARHSPKQLMEARS